MLQFCTDNRARSPHQKGTGIMINTLVEKIQKTNAPIVVGLDPMLKYIPEQIQKAAFA